MAQIRRILIGRVFNWSNYENLRISFEYEIEDGENPNRILLKAFEELIRINELLNYMNLTTEKWANLKEEVWPSKYNTIFETRREEILKKLGEKTKALECLKDIHKIPTVCTEELAGIRIDQVEEQKERLKKEIEELTEMSKKVDELEKEWDELRDYYYRRMEEAKQLFIERKYDECEEILDEINNRLNEYKKELKLIKPSIW